MPSIKSKSLLLSNFIRVLITFDFMPTFFKFLMDEIVLLSIIGFSKNNIEL